MCLWKQAASPRADGLSETVDVHEDALEEQTGAKPQRGIIQPDQPVDVCPGAAVVPGAEMMPP